jgi:EmrB/QacA subfamily drug resistance transporter
LYCYGIIIATISSQQEAIRKDKHMNTSPTNNLPHGPDSIRVAIPFAAIVLAMLPAVLDQTILATALPTIAGDLGSLSDVSWVVTAYVVAAAASMPLWGKLGDRHGRKLLLETALAAFVVSSALCAAAQDITQLVVLRMIQGAAAGGLMTLAMAAVGDLVSPRERGRYQGYIAAVFAAATVIGPLLGGVLVEGPGWRWVFLVNLPVGAVALGGLSLRLPSPPLERPKAALDLLGAGIIALATSTLMLTCILVGDRLAWDSPTVIGLAAATALLTAALLAYERRVEDPIVPFHLLRSKPVAVASLGLFLATASLFSVTVFVPLLLQTAAGASPTEAGLLLAPAMLGITISTTLSGRSIARTGRYKRFPIAGLALMTAALGLLAAFATDPSALNIATGLVVFGLGFGMVTQVLITAVQNTVERRELGIAMAVTGFFRGLGGAVGAAILGAVFASAAGSSVSDASGGGLHSVVRGDVIAGAQAVFLVAAPLAALALLIVQRLPEARLRTAAESEVRQETDEFRQQRRSVGHEQSESAHRDFGGRLRRRAEPERREPARRGR